jgi:hypothetical protein
LEGLAEAEQSKGIGGGSTRRPRGLINDVIIATTRDKSERCVTKKRRKNVTEQDGV